MKTKRTTLKTQLDKALAEISKLKADIELMYEDGAKVSARTLKLSLENLRLKNELTGLNVRHNGLVGDFDALIIDHGDLRNEFDAIDEAHRYVLKKLKELRPSCPQCNHLLYNKKKCGAAFCKCPLQHHKSKRLYAEVRWETIQNIIANNKNEP